MAQDKHSLRAERHSQCAKPLHSGHMRTSRMLDPSSTSPPAASGSVGVSTEAVSSSGVGALPREAAALCTGVDNTSGITSIGDGGGAMLAEPLGVLQTGS
jgi:hypothetical protein